MDNGVGLNQNSGKADTVHMYMYIYPTHPTSYCKYEHTVYIFVQSQQKYIHKTIKVCRRPYHSTIVQIQVLFCLFAVHV